MGGTEAEAGVRSLRGKERCQERAGAARAKRESQRSGFMDTEDKGISRKRELSAN